MGGPVMSMALASSTASGSAGIGTAIQYVVGAPSKGALSAGFTLTQDVGLDPLPGGGVQLTLGNMVQSFGPPVGGVYNTSGNNTAARLTRSGSGTSDEFTLTSRKGTVSTFWGFDPSIATPGRLKGYTDRYGNGQTHSWTTIGGTPRLASVTDSYGRTVTYGYASAAPHQLISISDFMSRVTLFQYDSAGRLVAVVNPAITRSATQTPIPIPVAWLTCSSMTQAIRGRHDRTI
jgi:YD repeat-containing protein